MSNHLINPELLAMSWETLASSMGSLANKEAFVAAGDPSMAGGPQGGAPPGGGPGGPPPGGPPPGPGGPPGAPPDSGGGSDPSAVAQAVVAGLQPMLQGMGAGGGGGMGGTEQIKPKIDVNVTLLQLLKMVARIADALNVNIPASEMVATQADLTGFAQQQQSGAPGTPPPSAIPPISPIQPAAPGMGGMPGGAGAGGGGPPAPKMANDRQWHNNGSPYDGFVSMGSRASAVAQIRSRRVVK